MSNEYKVAGGGFISTSEDLVKFGNEIISPKLLSRESLNELIKPQQTLDGKSTNYGIGFGIEKTKNVTPKYNHSGGAVGATTFLLIYPEESIVIAIVTNLSQVPIRDLVNELEVVLVN